MSIDIIADQLTTRQRVFNRAAVQQAVGNIVTTPAKHVVIVFGGWGSSDAGNPLQADVGPSTGTTALIKKIEQLKTLNGSGIIMHSYHGDLSELNRAESRMLQVLQSDFHPLGKLIMYGYSAGGYSAMRVAHRLGIVFPYYNTQTRAFLPFPPRQSGAGKGSRTVWGFARIDLLVTVDAAVGPQSFMSPRNVWPSVRTNLNIYQTVGASRARSGGTHSGVWSRGNPNTAYDETVTQVNNLDWTPRYEADPGGGHGRIDNDSIEVVLAAIREELDR